MRYEILEESSSGHCCFEYSVLDTKRVKTDDSGKDIGFETICICECWDKEDAELIVKALNSKIL